MLSRLLILALAVMSVICFGETEDIGDKSHKDVEELAEFAVGEIYGKADGRLAPVRVVDVQTQVTCQLRYTSTHGQTVLQNILLVC